MAGFCEHDNEPSDFVRKQVCTNLVLKHFYPHIYGMELNNLAPNSSVSHSSQRVCSFGIMERRFSTSTKTPPLSGLCVI